MRVQKLLIDELLLLLLLLLRLLVLLVGIIAVMNLTVMILYQVYTALESKPLLLQLNYKLLLPTLSLPMLGLLLMLKRLQIEQLLLLPTLLVDAQLLNDLILLSHSRPLRPLL